jgi:hypothetical protein
MAGTAGGTGLVSGRPRVRVPKGSSLCKNKIKNNENQEKLKKIDGFYF